MIVAAVLTRLTERLPPGTGREREREDLPVVKYKGSLLLQKEKEYSIF
jgi:hypothetical protein